MTFPRRDSLTVQYSTHNCTLTDRDKDDYEAMLDSLVRVVETFPASSLHVEIRHQPRSNEWEVKLSLSLARRHNVFSREVGEFPHPAFKQGVRRLVERVEAFKETRTPRGRRDVEVPATFVRAPVAPDTAQLAAAAERGDYVAFRDAIAIYRESLEKRIGRRIELWPEATAALGDRFTIADCAEAVFLDAFEQFDRLQAAGQMSFGERLEGLIDGALASLLADPDEVRRNVDMVRTARDARHEAAAKEAEEPEERAEEGRG